MIEVEICLGSACFVKGSQQVVTIIKELIATNHWEQQVLIKGAFCMGKCSEKGLGIKINGKAITGIGIYNAKEQLTELLGELIDE